MKKFLAAALLSSASVPVVFANTNAGSVWYVSTASVADSDLDQAGFEALTYVQIANVGNVGETGIKTNMVNYDTWDTTVSQKAKGVTDAGSPTIECARKYNDAGQIIMRAAGAPTNNLNYAFKEVRNDAITVGGTGTTVYNRGLVVGPTRPHGKNEDFDLEVYTIGCQQAEVVVDPTAGGVAPELTVAPVISGTLEVGEIITTTTGTFTGDAVITYAYQWFSGGVAIPGATANTYTLQASDEGNKMQVRVFASNASGTAVGFSALSAAVAP